MGANHSGEDMEAGRVNRAEDRTIIWAQRTDSDDGDDYIGGAIFIAEIAKDVEDPEDFLNNDWRPQHPLDGVVGNGWRTGVGVAGNGGQIAGTGVVGRGAPSGAGGIGVHGIGGSGTLVTLVPGGPVDPGPGMIGQGGKQDDFDTARKSQGGGVIGVGGAIAVPGFAETGSVGVFGQGSDAISRTVSNDGVLGTSGPKDPGAGVIGRGGIQVSDGGTLSGALTPTADPTGAGVIGLGGGVPVPAFAETGNTGVFGKGAVGVKGFSSDGIGVLGTSDSFEGVHGTGARQSARGGVFDTRRAAQVRLVPHDDGNQPQLPKDGQPGDLIATTFGVRDQQFCQLYFCVAGPSGATAAQWAPVQLGANVSGNV